MTNTGGLFRDIGCQMTAAPKPWSAHLYPAPTDCGVCGSIPRCQHDEPIPDCIMQAGTQVTVGVAGDGYRGTLAGPYDYRPVDH